MGSRLEGFLAGHGLPTWFVPDYWFMLTLAIITASLMTLHLWSKHGQKNKVAADLLFWGIPALFAGTKFFYYLQYGFPSALSEFWTTSGFALYGGLFGILSAWAIYYFLRPVPFLYFLDCFTPPLAFGLFLGRIGCFLAGCNGGIVSGLPWAVRFPRGTPVYYHQTAAELIEGRESQSLPVHPTQLYESIFALIAFVLLLFLLKRRLPDGQVFLTGMLWYSIYRFATEFIRADAGGLSPFGIFTFSQFVSLIVAVVSIGGLISLRVSHGASGVKLNT